MAGRSTTGSREAAAIADAAPGASQAVTLTRPQATHVLGVSTRTFERLVAEGVLAPLPGTSPQLFDAAGVVRGYLKHLEDKAGYLDANTERARLANAQRQRIELELAVRRSELAPAAEWVSAQVAIAESVRERVLGIAGQAVQLGLVPADREAQLDTLCREALAAVAAGGSR